MKNFQYLLPLMFFILYGCAAGKEVTKEPPEPEKKVGWIKIGSVWCYSPPDFSAFTDILERKNERSKAIDEIFNQFDGKKDPSFKIDKYTRDTLETILLERSDMMEPFLEENFKECVEYAEGRKTFEDYQNFLLEKANSLSEGRCKTPFNYYATHYLDVQKGWQFELPLCEGDTITIKASDKDLYTIKKSDKKGEVTEWINVEGRIGSPAEGADWPCQKECNEGQLIGRFIEENGTVHIFPVGAIKMYRAPAHGTISFTVNDSQFFDNAYRRRGRIEDRVIIEVMPAEGY